MDFGLLKQLINQHSVTGDSEEALKFITDYLNSNNIHFVVQNNGTIIAGNCQNPNILLSAHYDEIGFQITKIQEDGRVKFLPIGWIFPNRLSHQQIYIKTKSQKVLGLVLPYAELKAENISDFSDLYIYLGTDSKNGVIKTGVREGQTGTFTKEYFEDDEKIIAGSLDNKICVALMLEIASKNKEFLQDNALAFVHDEEMEDHGANGLQNTLKPKLVVVLDYCPVHHKLGNEDHIEYQSGKPIIMYRGGNYIIHEQVRNILEENFEEQYTKGFLSNKTLPILEPSNFENNGATLAFNLCLPAFGYHGKYYLVNKKDIFGTERFLQKFVIMKT